MKGRWGPFQTMAQLPTDAQILANGHIVEVDAGDGVRFKLVSSPVKFDEKPFELQKGPEHAQHTEEVLIDHERRPAREAQVDPAGGGLAQTLRSELASAISHREEPFGERPIEVRSPGIEREVEVDVRIDEPRKRESFASPRPGGTFAHLGHATIVDGQLGGKG